MLSLTFKINFEEFINSNHDRKTVNFNLKVGAYNTSYDVWKNLHVNELNFYDMALDKRLEEFHIISSVILQEEHSLLTGT